MGSQRSLRGAIPEGPAGEAVVSLLRTVLRLMELSLVGIVVFGIVRVATYANYEWNPAAGVNQLWLLGVKHVAFAVFFGFGLWYYVAVKRRLRSVQG